MPQALIRPLVARARRGGSSCSPKTCPRRPDQQVHARRLTHGGPGARRRFLAGQRRPVCGGCPDPRRCNDRILSNDLLGCHPGRQAVKDHAHRHPGTGEHGLPVHNRRAGRDQLHLLGRHSPGLPRQRRFRDLPGPSDTPAAAVMAMASALVILICRFVTAVLHGALSRPGRCCHGRFPGAL
jgi:hypothetical protein